jgi:integrase
MPRALTARSVETLKAGPRRQEIPDRHLPSLYLILQPSGARGWAVRYRVGGRSRKYTIGPYPAIDLKTARELGAKALRQVAEGRDPSREKALARSAEPDSVEAVVRQFIDLHCKRKNKARTIVATQQALERHVLSRWRTRPIKEITRRDVLDLIDGIVAKAPVSANRVLTILGTLFSFAMDRDIIASSPCAGVKSPTEEQSRDRVLSAAELGNVWRAAEKLGGPYGELVKLLVLTGARRDEVASMTWGEVDLDARLWKLPAARTKNGRPHEIHLSGPVLAILQSLPRRGDTFVLTAAGAAPVSNFSKSKRALDALLPAMARWVLHDLRRSAATGMADLGVQPHVIEAVLNHVGGHKAGVAGVYNRANYVAEKGAALDAWGEHVAKLAAE